MKTSELIALLTNDLNVYGDIDVPYVHIPLVKDKEGYLILDLGVVQNALQNRGKSYEG